MPGGCGACTIRTNRSAANAMPLTVVTPILHNLKFNQVPPHAKAHPGAVGIGRAGRGRRECRHRRKGGRCKLLLLLLFLFPPFTPRTRAAHQRRRWSRLASSRPSAHYGPARPLRNRSAGRRLRWRQQGLVESQPHGRPQLGRSGENVPGALPWMRTLQGDLVLAEARQLQLVCKLRSDGAQADRGGLSLGRGASRQELR